MDNFPINLIGGGFQHAYSSCGWEYPKYVCWDKTNHLSNISCHVDGAIFDIPVNKTKFSIAWFAESPWVVRNYTQLIETQYYRDYLQENYEFTFSCDKTLIIKYPFIKYCIPTAVPWIQNKGIHKKTKLISIIVSEKKESPGHKLRHDLVNELKNYIDIFGRGYNQIEKKEIGLNDYRYSIVTENIKCPGYFTEKIADCFATGTIPIYWGDETIGAYFDENGIIKLTDDFDFNILTEELYNTKLNSIKNNYNKILEFITPEDYIYINYLK